MSVMSPPIAVARKSTARVRLWTLRMKLTAALTATGLVPSLLIIYVGHITWWALVPAVAITLFFTITLSRYIMTPILRLRATAQRVQAGDFRARSNIELSDEIGDIACAIDAITEHALTLINELESQRLELENRIIQLFTELSQAANGDLTVRPTTSEGSL